MMTDKMLYIAIFVSIYLHSCFAQDDSVCKTEEYHEGQRYIYFPDGNDKLHLVDLEDKTDVRPRIDEKDYCKLFIYTRKNRNNPDVLHKGDLSGIKYTQFDATKPVKVVFHGWISDYKSSINEVIKSKFLAASDVNVIFVTSLNYFAAVNVVPKVGRFVASVIDKFINIGVSINQFHILGHSLGAHAAGICGRHIKSGLVPYISAFDPALPLWNPGSERIRKTDAKYVEVIHSNSGYLGITEPVGHADFYPNGGTSQPGCSCNIACSHSRSYRYFANSLDHKKFMGSKCKSVEEVKSKTCANLGQLHMGGSMPKDESGIFYLVTKPDPPFY